MSASTTATVRSVLLATARALGSAAEARWLVEHVLGDEANATVAAATGTPMEPAAVSAVEELVARRLAGEPVQYLLGHWAFRQLELQVDSRVLIPRPETEVVTGYALDELARAVDDLPRDTPVHAVDLGTGSGAIALSLAVEGPARLGGRPLEIWAVEVSPDAREVAAANTRAVAGQHRSMAPVQVLPGSWFEPLPATLAGAVTLVVANPPYVAEGEWAALDAEVRREPRQALVGGPTGTEALDRIVEQAPSWLAPWGVLVVELAPHQAEDLALRALVAGFDGVLVRHDLAGRPRALIARRWS